MVPQLRPYFIRKWSAETAVWIGRLCAYTVFWANPLSKMILNPPITSRTNARVKVLRASFHGGASAAGDILGIEGEHLISEAVRSGMKLQAVFVRQGSEGILQRFKAAAFEGVDVLILSRDAFASAVETASPQGIAATFVLRPPEPEPVLGDGAVLVFENLQDPGNLGTLIRSAEAFGAQQIFVTPDTANQWNPKVVRASAGSVFRVPVVRAPMEEIIKQMTLQGMILYAAVAQEAGAASILEMQFARRCGLMIGNEGAGLSRAALRLAHHCVRIPCAVESLNAAVAGSTLLYEAMRQRACMSPMKDAR
jgi:TrmH family RNA methyltransferase